MLKPGSRFLSVEEALIALGEEVANAGRRARVAHIERHGSPPNDLGRPDSWGRLIALRREADIERAIERSDLTPDEIDKRDRIQLNDIWSREFFAREERLQLKPVETVTAEVTSLEVKSASAVFASEVEAVLATLDAADAHWNDLGVFRGCRDRLRKALGEFKAAKGEPA